MRVCARLEGERQWRMWDREGIRDAVVATTVRVGVRTLTALRMFPARPTFTRRCGEWLEPPRLQSPPADQPSDHCQLLLGETIWLTVRELQSSPRREVFKPTTNDDGLCDHDSRFAFFGCLRALL